MRIHGYTLYRGHQGRAGLYCGRLRKEVPAGCRVGIRSIVNERSLTERDIAALRTLLATIDCENCRRTLVFRYLKKVAYP